MAQTALQRVLANPAVTCAIPGAKNVAQITSNVNPADGEFLAEDLARLARVTAGR